MQRIAIASVTTVLLVVAALVLTAPWDPDGWMWDARRDAAGGSMMSAGAPGLMRYGMVRSVADYLVEMVAHHEDAIVAASELERSDRRRMRALGRSIVESQSAQVEQMRAWLSAWYPDEDDAEYEPMMSDLGGLSGDRLDRRFLREMVPHHMMAVMMSQQLLVRGMAEHDEVATLARTIRDDQRAEIRLMVRWSRAWFGTRPMMGPWGR